MAGLRVTIDMFGRFIFGFGKFEISLNFVNIEDEQWDAHIT